MNDQDAQKMVVDQSYWDSSYKKLTFFRLPPHDPTAELLKRHIPAANADKSAFEIGGFPGRFLAELGELGYILNGCDLTPRTADMGPWLAGLGFSVGEFNQAPYQEFLDRQYDVVASFGFIEHFEDFQKLFLQHCDMVAPGGYVVVQFPNFLGNVQHRLHKFFDRDNLSNHVVSAMNVSAYTDILPKGFDLLYAGYYGAFDFWTDDFRKRNGPLRRRLLKTFMKTKSLWARAPNDFRWSPHGMVIARRGLA